MNVGSLPATDRRRQPRRHIMAMVAAVAAAIIVLLTAATVLAHSGLGAASPAPGSTVGGEITVFELRYNSTVTDVEGSVTDPNGDLIDSDWVQEGNLRVTVSLAEPLSVPGEYAVRHATTSVDDNDRVAAAYLFTYDPTAPPPQLEIVPDDGGFPWVWVVLAGGAILIAVLGWQLSRSLHRARNRAST